MRQEHVTLKNVEISELFDRIKNHLQEIKLDIIHEEKEKDYWDLKAHKGSKGSVIVGNIRDVEVMISGSKDSGHDLVFANWCMGERHNRPYNFLGRCDCRLAVAPVALAEIYRAHAFEKHFWDFIRKETAILEKGRQKCLVL